MPFGPGGEWGRARYGCSKCCGDRRRGIRVSLGVSLRHPIVNNGEFVASLSGIAYSDRAVFWRGEWDGPRHLCVRWKSTCLKGKGLVSGIVSGIFRNFGSNDLKLNGEMAY